jgi:hypothetical protein
VSRVTATRPAANSSARTRNAGQTSRSEAVTASGTESNAAGPGAVTCRACGADIPPDKALVVVSGYNRTLRRSGDPVCADCANANHYLWPWPRPLPPGRSRSDYEHRCRRCGRFFYGGVQRRYCSDDCGERTRRARRRRHERFPYEQLCATCGAVFIRSRPDAAYCSGACRQKAYRRRAVSP